VKEKWQIKPEPNPLARGTKITTRTLFLSGENEADFSDVYLVDNRRSSVRASLVSGLKTQRDVRFWHLADIDADDEHVCFWG
jgi:hypothetical protein